MNAESQCVPPFEQGTVEISRVLGPEAVPAVTHPRCPGLAVTMADFGTFRVTHVASGMFIGGAYERWSSAALEMVEWSAIARALGFSWLEPCGPAISAALRAGGDRPVPFAGATSTDEDGTHPMSVMDWVQITRGTFVEGEFPWESSDESPAARAMVLLESIATPNDGPRAPGE